MKGHRPIATWVDEATFSVGPLDAVRMNDLEDFVNWDFADQVRSAVTELAKRRERHDRQMAFLMWGVHL